MIIVVVIFSTTIIIFIIISIVINMLIDILIIISIMVVSLLKHSAASQLAVSCPRFFPRSFLPHVAHGNSQRRFTAC